MTTLRLQIVAFTALSGINPIRDFSVRSSGMFRLRAAFRLRMENTAKPVKQTI